MFFARLALLNLGHLLFSHASEDALLARVGPELELVAARLVVLHHGHQVDLFPGLFHAECFASIAFGFVSPGCVDLLLFPCRAHYRLDLHLGRGFFLRRLLPVRGFIGPEDFLLEHAVAGHRAAGIGVRLFLGHGRGAIEGDLLLVGLVENALARVSVVCLFLWDLLQEFLGDDGGVCIGVRLGAGFGVWLGIGDVAPSVVAVVFGWAFLGVHDLVG